MYAGKVPVDEKGEVNLDRVCWKFDAKPYFVMASDSKGAGMAPAIEPDWSAGA